jgi:hypothetical protein
MSEAKFPTNNELEFNKFLVREYLKHGSVDEVLRVHKFDLPLSYASYQRILDKWHIVKAAGPNSTLSEAISFFSKLAYENVPFEVLYKKMPPSFQTSAVTLYRILAYMKEGLTRRVGAALIITPYNDSQKILVANDISTPRLELGKPYGAVSIPMGYAKKRETWKNSVLRILQHEVFTQKAIENVIPDELLGAIKTPFMYLDVVDVRVSVYHLQLPKSYSSLKSFSSFKLKDYRFEQLTNLVSNNARGGNFRTGLVEAVTGYKKYLNLLTRNLAANPLQQKSFLNREIATVEVEIEG